MLPNTEGQIVAELGEAPGPDDDLVPVQFTVGEGLYRLAVVGRYTDVRGRTQDFVTSSVLIVAGDLAPDMAELL